MSTGSESSNASYQMLFWFFKKIFLHNVQAFSLSIEGTSVTWCGTALHCMSPDVQLPRQQIQAAPCWRIWSSTKWWSESQIFWWSRIVEGEELCQVSMFALTMLEPVCMTYLFDQLVYWIVFFFWVSCTCTCIPGNVICRMELPWIQLTAYVLNMYSINCSTVYHVYWIERVSTCTTQGELVTLRK